MSQRFVCPDREQSFLMPPSLREWLAEGHLAWFVLDVVDELDLDAFYGDYRADGHGRPAHDPAFMVALVLYAFATGTRSAREIERRCVVDVAYRVLAGNLKPDHSTIARFLDRHEDRLAGLFGQILGLCAKAQLIDARVVAIDSTKIHAAASGQANKTYEQLAKEFVADAIATNRAEDEQFGERRGDELPAELADPKTRRAKIKELMGEMQAEWQAQRDERQAMLDAREGYLARTGRPMTGRPPKPRDMTGDPPGRVNVTDPDSRPVRTPRGFIQGFNAHAAVADGQIIIAADVSIGTRDQGHLEPIARAANEALDNAGTGRPQVVLADCGYWAGDQIRQLIADGITTLVSPDAHTRTEPNPQRRGGLYEQMRRWLASDQGAQLYRRRMAMIEPVFGQTKTNRRADRFRRRGLKACQAEWQLISATHNLLKLYRAAPAS